MNEVSGSLDRYAELYGRLKDSNKVAVEAQSLIFTLGASLPCRSRRVRCLNS